MSSPALRNGDKLPELVVGPFLPENLAAYAEASGDSNPLHLELPFARRFGFSARPVHGMRLLAAFEQLLQDWRGDLMAVSLKGQFLTPVLEGQCATLSGRVAKIENSDAGCCGVIRLMARTDQGAPALVGEARVVPRP
jgi:acyl dehydratase